MWFSLTPSRGGHTPVWQDVSGWRTTRGSEARMNSVAFVVIIAVMTILSMVVIQKVLDDPNH